MDDITSSNTCEQRLEKILTDIRVELNTALKRSQTELDRGHSIVALAAMNCVSMLRNSLTHLTQTMRQHR